MSCIFDCTQFLTFNSSKTIKIDEIREVFLNYGFQTKINREIDSSKQQYFSQEYLDTIIEFADETFLGEFEDWEEEAPTPERVQDFIDVFCELEKKYSFDDYKIILVESVDEIQSYVGIERIVVQNTLDKELLHVSNKMFDYWGNVYIFSKFAHNNIAKEIDEISDLSGHVMENSCFVYESGGESKIREWRYERFYDSLEKLCSLSKNKKHISKNLAGELFKLYKNLYKSVETFDESDSFYLELEKLEKYLEKLFWNFSLFEEQEVSDPFIGVPCYKFQHSAEIQEKIDSLSKKISEGSLSAHEEKIARKMLKKLQGF